MKRHDSSRWLTPGPRIFKCIFNFSICDQQTPQHQHDCVASSSIFLLNKFELCGGACAIKINEIESRWQWGSPFSHVPIVCNFLISDIWSALHATFAMMDPPAPTCCPQNGRRCPQPCCKVEGGSTKTRFNVRFLLMILMMLILFFVVYIYLWAKNRPPPCTAPQGFRATVLIKLIMLI